MDTRFNSPTFGFRRASRTAKLVSVLALLGALVAATVLSAQGARAPQQPARDTPAQKEAAASPSGEIKGRVVASDTGMVIKRARVLISSQELSPGRAVQTDDSGVYDFTELPAGRYNVTVSKVGFISISYGQRRPQQPGTPLQLGENQRLAGVDFSLPRGGVIAGRLLDEDGGPMVGAAIRVMQYQYVQTQRSLVPAGTAQTDDRGQYRVWGLMPGEYYISANVAGGGPGGGRGGGRGGPPDGSPGEQEALGYVATYYPGVGTITEARPVTLGVSEEILDANFAVQLVHAASISGRVTHADGSAATNGNVELVSDAANASRGNLQLGRSAGRIRWDGAFTIGNVAPGRYFIRARSEDSGQPEFALQPLTVSESLSDLIVILMPGATVSGTVTFQQTQLSIPGDLTQVRIGMASVDGSTFGAPVARVEKDGKFTLTGVQAGGYLLRAAGAPRGWMLKSVIVDGHDVVDTPIEVRGRQQLTGLRVVFTDRLGEISGTVTDQAGSPVTDLTILAFPTERSLWWPQARQIMIGRPDQNGRFQISGLPAGEYYVAAVDPARQGEWFEQAFLEEQVAGASRLTLGDGAVKTQDFRIPR